MIPQAEIGLILARDGLQGGYISPDLYALVIFVSLGTTLLTPVFLKTVYSRLEE
ncbi:hypothetical protein GF326_04315 [Candidatus Bathyarchaeota archaeon]|nr:hypothetical protein [Candidatus Bathyarchaeota archaeon]